MNRAENSGCVLKSYRSYGRRGKAAESRESLDVGDNSRAARRVESGDG
jgi:hypothetical protein